MKKIIIGAILVLAIPSFGASVIRQAKEALKKGQNLEQTAKNLLTEATKAETRHRDRIVCFELAAECARKINDQQNMKMYLRQKSDTAVFYQSILDQYTRLGQADSIARTPDEKGRVNTSSSKHYRDWLNKYRTNLMAGGNWFYRKGEPSKAYPYFDTYVSCQSSPIFAADSLARRDSLLPLAAYMATVSAHSANQPDGVIRHAQQAQKAGLKSHLMQEYLCRAYLAKADTVHQIEALWHGLDTYPRHLYFFSNIVDHLSHTGQLEKGLGVADSLTRAYPEEPLFWYAQSVVLLRLNRDREAITACDSCLARDSSYVDAYYNKGIASLNLAVIYTEQACTDLNDPRCLRDQQIIRSLYNLAKLPMERVRELAPDDTTRWAAPLYRIYLHLNMGREFDEMDRLLNSR